MNIGVFDSGLGGMAVLKEVIKALPQYNYIYYGDNIRAPYGNRSAQAIYEFTKNAVDFLVEKNCKLIIFACNTVTITSLRKIQQEYLPKKYSHIKILGVVRPAVEEIRSLNAKKVGIIGTTATIDSKQYIKEIKAILPEATVYQKACPLFVPIIEEGKMNWRGLDLILKEYLRPLKQKRIDSLILGCTHYIWIEGKIKKYLGDAVKVISQDGITATKLKNYLSRHPEIESNLDKNNQRTYYFSDLNNRYDKLIKTFLGSYLRDKDRVIQA